LEYVDIGKLAFFYNLVGFFPSLLTTWPNKPMLVLANSHLLKLCFNLTSLNFKSMSKKRSNYFSHDMLWMLISSTNTFKNLSMYKYFSHSLGKCVSCKLSQIALSMYLCFYNTLTMCSKLSVNKVLTQSLIWCCDDIVTLYHDDWSLYYQPITILY
jgi:hypothetical protein